ncbi:MAG: cell division protein SepF [Coriobacteriia bacterium]|nr:cell division protein SepF [Coriobacteriia bacterium]
MANSTFSDLSDRASGALSGLRNRFGGSRNRDQYQDGYDDYGYDDYGDYNDYADYGEYGYDGDDPYDDIDDAPEIGGIRTRQASAPVKSNPRNHPPLLSFDEARVNTYVPDRLMRDPLEHVGARSPRYSVNGYRPRIRESVNLGHAAEYDFASVGGAQIDETGAEVPQVEVSKPSQPGAYDPYASYQGAGATTHNPTRRLKIVAPQSYGDVESVARALRTGDLVVLNLVNTPGDLVKRVLDFSFGVASALDASVDCVAEKVFVICRGQGLTEAERTTLRSQGIVL